MVFAVAPGFVWARAATSFPHGAVTLVADAVLVVACLSYLGGVRRLAARGRRWSTTSTVAFLAGAAAVFVAVGSGLAIYEDVDFTVHIVQHLLLMFVAPMLFALGRPVTLITQAAPRRWQVRVVRAANSRAARVAVGWPAWIAQYLSMPAYLLTGIYGLSLRNQVVHDLVHVWFLSVGILFWQGVLGLDPVRRRLSFLQRLGALMAAMPIESALGVVLMATPVRLIDATSVSATHGGGQVLWMGSMVASGVGLVVVLGQWALADERRAQAGLMAPAGPRAGH